MLGKIYTHQEIAEATELVCVTCGRKAETDPKSNVLPVGWRKVPITTPNRLAYECPECDASHEKDIMGKPLVTE